jgi:DNA-binding response OmpR family regulator
MALRRVLLIGDEQTLVNLLSFCTRQGGFQAPQSQNRSDNTGEISSSLPDLVVLNLPPGTGEREIAQYLQGNDLPISALDPTRSRNSFTSVPDVLGDENRARGQRNVIQHIGVVVDRDRHSVHFEGREVSLTPSEFRLLECFIVRPGRAFTRAELVKAMWPDKDVTEERIVDQNIKFLRRKLGRPDLIETVHGIGYRFREAPL